MLGALSPLCLIRTGVGIEAIVRPSVACVSNKGHGAQGPSAPWAISSREYPADAVDQRRSSSSVQSAVLAQWFIRVRGCSVRRTSQAENAGSIPVARSLQNSQVRCAAPVAARHSGSGACTTLSGPGSGRWATLAPVARRHLAIRPDGRRRPFTVSNRAHKGRRCVGGAGSRGTAV